MGVGLAHHDTDFSRPHRVAGAPEADSIAINEYPAAFVEAPFGGYEQRG